MTDFFRSYDDFFLLETLPILIRKTGLDVYDFRFRDLFECRSITQSVPQPVLLRVGAIDDFASLASSLNNMGMTLLFTQEQHERSSMLENWYPLLADYTPFSRVYERLPPLEQVLQEFTFPIFVKGNRQTGHHKKSQSIIANAAMYESLAAQWNTDKYLHWQKAVVRNFVPLKTVDDKSFPDMIPASHEFRIFFWKKRIVGIGRYWCMVGDYSLDERDRERVLHLAQQAADIVDVPFLGVDIAKTQDNDWIVIEVNDGQESGYAGIDRYTLWKTILEVERELS